jgi:hypothetical protein
MEKPLDFKKLYLFQDKVLKIISRLETEFYLTGGTASSRAYLQHRYSEDLDFFVNDDDRFNLWADRVIHALSALPDWRVEVFLKESRFVRLSLARKDTVMKIEMVNDVPSHVGDIRQHEVLGRIDSPENILANKITAVMDRQEPKDLADIWGFCCKMGLSLSTAITDAQSKAAGIFPPDLARVLCSVTKSDWEAVRWIEAPDQSDFVDSLRKLGESLILL